MKITTVLIILATIFGAQQPHRSTRFKLGYIDAEMLTRYELLDGLKEQCIDLACHQSVAVLGISSVVPDFIIDSNTQKPAEHQVIIQPLQDGQKFL